MTKSKEKAPLSTGNTKWSYHSTTNASSWSGVVYFLICQLYTEIDQFFKVNDLIKINLTPNNEAD